MFKNILKNLKKVTKTNNKQSQRQYNNRNNSVPKGNKKENYFMYCLKLSNGGIYVGITNNPQRRFKEHSTGNGAKVTKAYPPLGVISCVPLGYMTYAQAERFEDDKTLELMQQYGYQNVRGGHWSMVNNQAIYSALSNNRTRILKDFNRDVYYMFK